MNENLVAIIIHVYPCNILSVVVFCTRLYIFLQIKIIVAGGCLKACFENPPLASAEMYDPKTDKWEKLPDLPFPLNGAKMELLDGVPTIFGGFDGVTQNGLLIQYHDRLKEWIPHPTIRMRIPRSSAAVFQVPRHLFPKQCS